MKNITKKMMSFLLLFALLFTMTVPSVTGEALAATKSETISGIKQSTIKAKSSLTSKGRIKLTWTKSKGYSVDFYEVYRATSKSGEYKKIHTTKTGKTTSVVNSSVKEGKKYYYKVRGVRKIDGKKYYTKWSNIVSRTAKMPEITYDNIPDVKKSSDGKYKVAMVVDGANLKDGSYNEATWNGCKKYAYDAGKSYKYYIPEGDYTNALKKACKNGAEVVVVNGFLFGDSLGEVAPMYPDVQFIFIDGWDCGYDNVVGISYSEEEAGFLAGYAAVMEGFTSLGFSGGGGGYNPACARYGYGFAQGADKAAENLGMEVEMRYSWEYGETFSASKELKRMLTGWYEDGTEAIFVCGGSMVDSAIEAAENCDGYIIGVDVDQSGLSKTVITSAMKSYDTSAYQAIKEFYKKGKVITGSTIHDCDDKAVCLPTANWRLANWSVKEYNAFYKDAAAGKYDIESDFYSDPLEFGLEYVTFIS